MPSPKPRPTVLKLIEGRGPGRDSGGRPVKATPRFTRLPPNAPTWLPAEAKAEWRRVVPELARLQLLKPVDRAALTAYCLAWERLVTAQKLIKSNGGLTYVDAFGNPRKHPAVLVAEAASKELRAWASEFGMTPSAEQRVAKAEADDGEEDNPFAG
ncbi:MAG: phage terminase small subunit P27 family [Actinocrinis sp.]